MKAKLANAVEKCQRTVQIVLRQGVGLVAKQLQFMLAKKYSSPLIDI